MSLINDSDNPASPGIIRIMEITSDVIQERWIEKLPLMFGVMFFGKGEINGYNFQRRKTQSGVEFRKSREDISG
jgi:hypothetical protein